MIEDYSLKKEYTFIRFGYEISALLFAVFLITCIDRNLQFTEFFLLSLSITFFIFSTFKIKFLKKIQFLFNKFFFYISKVINPILMIIVYLISIVPISILLSLKRMFFKKKIKNSYWINYKTNEKTIDFDEQF